MTKLQLKELGNFIATLVGNNNQSAELLIKLALKFKDFFDIAKYMPTQLQPYALSVIGYVMSNM